MIATYNDTAGLQRVLEQHGRQLAAIVVEPMIGSGGCIPATPEFLQALRVGADESGALLIFDEVMTSRMSGGGLQELLGITPDMTTLGKYVGGGMSFGAFGGKAEVMSMYDPRRVDAVPHAGTFNNNVFTMAAGYAGLTEVFTPAVADTLFSRGEPLRSELNRTCARRGARMQWTGQGSLLAAHFQTGPIRSPGEIEQTPELRELFHLEMIGRGFYLARRGMIALSLAVDADDCRSFIAAVGDFLDVHHELLAANES